MRTLSSSYPTDETKLLTAVDYVLLWKLRLPVQNYALLCRLDAVLWSLESCAFFIICLVRTLFRSSHCWWSKIEIIEKGSLKAAHPGAHKSYFLGCPQGTTGSGDENGHTTCARITEAITIASFGFVWLDHRLKSVLLPCSCCMSVQVVQGR